MVPLANVFVELLEIPTVLLPLYLWPFTVTDHALDAEDEILPDDPAISCIFQLTVVVFDAMDWLFTSQENRRVSQVVTFTSVFPLFAI